MIFALCELIFDRYSPRHFKQEGSEGEDNESQQRRRRGQSDAGKSPKAGRSPLKPSYSSLA